MLARFAIFLAFVVRLLGQSFLEDVLVFDEDDAIGQGYYDASVAQVQGGSQLEVLGPFHDKLPIDATLSHHGKESARLAWRIPPGGAWSCLVASPGFEVRNIQGYQELRLFLRLPAGESLDACPSLALEGATGERSLALPLANYVQSVGPHVAEGWLQVEIPLRDFGSFASPARSHFLGTRWSGGRADNQWHRIWFDDVRLIAPVPQRPQTPPDQPGGLVARAGDRSVALHWDAPQIPASGGYHVYRSMGASHDFHKLTSLPVPGTSFADCGVTNGDAYYYQVAACNTAGVGLPSQPLKAVPRPFANDAEFLELLERTAFDYFWYEADPGTGLVFDRSEPYSPASIAATGFGLTAMAIASERGWLSRDRAADRVARILRTLARAPQGPGSYGIAGYRGWFYHFLEPPTGLRAGNCELSSIDTALLLAGVLDAREYFASSNQTEVEIRSLAQAILHRVDWRWMTNRESTLSMGWLPGKGFIPNRWIGYNEAMILYVLAIGARDHPLPSRAWKEWCSGYRWETHGELSFVAFPPLFGHQYSHCWVDFRHRADPWMRLKGISYFENSRRATLAQQAYATRNPGQFPGYGPLLWGFTACDGPGTPGAQAYIARGAPPAEHDDGTIAPTAVGGSLPFAPEVCLPTLREMYQRFRPSLWTGYGFRDAFNLQADWWGTDVIGVDQGPILLMIENYRSEAVWRRFMRAPEVVRGLRRAGFCAFETP